MDSLLGAAQTAARAALALLICGACSVGLKARELNFMTRIPLDAESRITRDAASGTIRTWFNPQFHPAAKQDEAPQHIAQAVLSDSADLFNWKSDLPDIAQHAVIAGPG